MKRKNLPYGWDLPVMKSKLVCKILFSVKREFPNKKEEQTHNDTISFKRFTLLRNGNLLNEFVT